MALPDARLVTNVRVDRCASEAILMRMRTTLILDDRLVERAQEASGITGTTAVLHAGLLALIARESARRLAALGGSEPTLRPVHRRRSRSGPPR
jgi:hypothetical protein